MSEAIASALRTASDTRVVEIAPGAIARCGQVFREQFGDASAIIVADLNTFEVAGRAVTDSLHRAGVSTGHFIYDEREPDADWDHVVRLQAALRDVEAIPIAVGAGVINDLVKLAAHELGRQYIAVATAASMDGYAAFGASIMREGSKQTFSCPAPRAVVADMEVIAGAPQWLTAAGYADLLAKVTAGADWIVADALGVEPIDPVAWEMVQSGLKDALRDPKDVMRLIEKLILSGLAMQRTESSRPASGAEHQFSHLWDMQHHTHEGGAPSHGFKVGVATLAVAQLYERLFGIDQFDPVWVDWIVQERQLRERFPEPALLQKAIDQTRAKHVTRDVLHARVERLNRVWRQLQRRLSEQLIPSSEMRRMLRDAGAPAEPHEIGITRERLRESFRLAYHIRRRYTVLDLAVETGVLDRCLR